MVIPMSFPLAAHAAPTLLVPDTVVKGQEFEARIENAPGNAKVQWTWDQGRLRLLESSDSAARFETILDGTAWIEAGIGAWRQRVTIVITKDSAVKPPPPGGEPTKDPKIASIEAVAGTVPLRADQCDPVFPEHGQRGPVRQGPCRLQGACHRTGTAAAHQGGGWPPRRSDPHEPGALAERIRPL